MRNTRGNDNKLLAYSKWRGRCVHCPLNKSERHMTKIWKRCFDAKVEFRVGGSSSVVEDHDGSILCTEDGANFRSIDRSKVSINRRREGEFIRRFGMRCGGSIGWLFEGWRGDGCLISKKFLTRARLTESQENLHSLSYSKAVQFRGYKAIKERK